MRALHTRFKRLLKLRNLEFFQLVLSDDERSAFLLVLEERLFGILTDFFILGIVRLMGVLAALLVLLCLKSRNTEMQDL